MSSLSENVRENKDDCMRLAGRAGHILLNLNSRLTSVLPPSNHWERDPVLWDRTREAIPFGLRMNVDRFEKSVSLFTDRFTSLNSNLALHIYSQYGQ